MNTTLTGMTNTANPSLCMAKLLYRLLRCCAMSATLSRTTASLP